jgi:hypothetical protein
MKTVINVTRINKYKNIPLFEHDKFSHQLEVLRAIETLKYFEVNLKMFIA